MAEEATQWRCRICKEFKDPSEFVEESHLGVKCRACRDKQNEETTQKRRETQRAYRVKQELEAQPSDPSMRRCRTCKDEFKIFMFEHTEKGVAKDCTPCRLKKKTQRGERKLADQKEAGKAEWEKDQEYERLRAEREAEHERGSESDTEENGGNHG